MREFKGFRFWMNPCWKICGVVKCRNSWVVRLGRFILRYDPDDLLVNALKDSFSYEDFLNNEIGLQIEDSVITLWNKGKKYTTG